MGINREKQKAYSKAYRLSHKKEVAARSKAYRLSHKKKMAAYHKAYRLSHKTEIAAQAKIYYYERKVRLWRGNSKTQKEELMFLGTLLAQTKKAARAEDHAALRLLKKKYEQLQIMVA